VQLFHPRSFNRPDLDPATQALMQKTIAFFENRGHAKLREDFHAKRWYEEFLAFIKEEKVFATLLTPAEHGGAGARWDTWRNCQFNEILAYYGLEYWYTWQVSILGLGPLWMSQNRAITRRTADLLGQGGIFAFGLSEKEHGADIYSTDMVLTRQPDGTFRANGRKYYIGNGNKAAIVSVFGKIADSGEYVFFAADSQHPSYRVIKNVIVSQSFVAEFELKDYPVRPEDIIAQGPPAWDSTLNTVNIGKYNLGWCSIGLCTHAFYEAIGHASRRHLYGKAVTDFPHVRQLMVDAYSRLIAMKAFSERAADYMRSASPEDRRYLLYNPVVKMKVTLEGESVINALWDVIAAKGFEKDTFFQEATGAIRALPKLEGTVHVNIALIVKFMTNYLFKPREYPPVGRRSDAANDSFLFDQGSTKGLSIIQFHDYRLAFAGFGSPNVVIFEEQVASLRTFLTEAPPSTTQREDIDFLLTMGQLFTQVVYAQLILEQAKLVQLSGDVVEQIFDFMVRDMSHHATTLYTKSSTTPEQQAHCLKLIKRPAHDAARYDRVWNDHVYVHRDAL
jgi:acyl-CoA dehydrogenase